MQVRALKAEREKGDITPLVIHSNYLINLAAPPSEVRENSIKAFCGEMQRALIIGAEYLVVHPGNYRGVGQEQGMLNVAEAMALAWRAVENALKAKPKLTVLLENTAGAGTQLGGDLTELATIQQLAQKYLDLPVGFCLDTCHAHVYKFDLATGAGFEAFLKTVRETLGVERVPVIHTNDAKPKHGSHLDRHANIGKGTIGVEGFRRILNHRDLGRKAFILETPDDGEGHRRDLDTLKALVAERGFKPAIDNRPTAVERSGRKDL